MLLLAACGSRTGLPIDGEGFSDDPDGSSDASVDGTVDDDADAGDEDALPGLDVQPNPDVVRNDCPDADATLIYVVTSDTDELLSFYPPDGSFKTIGVLRCPDPGHHPFSMAVDRKGVAFVVFDDGNLFRVSTATGACIPTSYRPNQLNVQTFGMGFSTDFLGPTETLFVAADSDTSLLGSINLSTFNLSLVGPFNPNIVRGELTGTGDGRLFSFYTKDLAPGSFIGEIEKTSAKIVAETPLPTVNQGQAWAFGFWGGDFYTFTAPNGGSTVQRYRPSDGSVATVSSYPSLIVGAGVSTCAPQQ